MLRILGDGKIMTVYKMEHLPRPKEVEIYEIPHPVYDSSLPQKGNRHLCHYNHCSGSVIVVIMYINVVFNVEILFTFFQ